MLPQPYLFLAPLRGITDATFRSVYAKHFPGISAAVAPFLNPQGNKSLKIKPIADLLPDRNTGMKVIPQLLDNTPEGFLNLALRLEDLGYDEINWNLGCPAAMVTKKKRGSGFLKHPEQIIFMLDSILPIVKSKISIKMRLGFESPEEAYFLLPQLNCFPLQRIIIHPRLGKQMYSGTPDLLSFEHCLTLTHHEVTYNGDIISKNIFSKLKARFPSVSSWMIGRGLLADPFLPAKIISESTNSSCFPVETIQVFHQELFEEYGTQLSGQSHLLGKMKQIWQYLGNYFPDSAKEIKGILKCSLKEDYIFRVQMLFGNKKS